MNFQFATANRIIFGRGSSQQLADLIAPYGTRVLLVTGSNTQRYSDIAEQLAQAHLTPYIFSVTHEPTVTTVNEGVALARSKDCDVVVSIGGGSVIDTGKAIAAITTNQGALLTYLEVVGEGQPLVNNPLPFIAIPTTAGTGAEVTKNAVISVEDKRVKVSLRDNRMLPDIALLDPLLTVDVPKAITATTGLDALTQVIEPYVSRLATPMTDLFCREAIPLGAKALRQVVQYPDDIDARETMLYVSLLGGLALANAKLGAVHGFAGALGGLTGAAHGAICGALLPHVTEANIRALHAAGNKAILRRYQEIAVWLTGRSNATVDEAVQWLHGIAAELEIPTLGALGLAQDDIASVVAQSQQSSSMKGNPITLSAETLKTILQTAL